MSFTIDVIPPSARNAKSIAAHKELYDRTMDVIRVHNPTDNDFAVYNDRRFSNETYVIPNKNKDIGYGKGNNDVVRYIAQRYVDKMGMEMINDKIKKDWDKKKMAYRLEERGQMEERYALKSNDPKLWDEVIKELWIGVVKRYQSDVFEEPEPMTPRKEYGSSAEEALDRLRLVDSEIGVQTDLETSTSQLDKNKQDFIESIQ